MMAATKASPTRNLLSAALFAALVVPASGALAQDAPEETTPSNSATTLDRVTVTGSLIPQSQIETFTPVTVITADDIQSRGFNTVADVLQQSSFSTGAVQGGQTSASFTQGAETISLFGLNPGYVKYLIDGRPMANYPALYNGSDAFNNISGIPVDLVERIEILPGGQSSLYGSDAIAGVINVILKKEMDGSVLNIRGGTYSDGGGNSFRGSFATGFSAADGRFNALLGIQHEERDPIWGYDREITSGFFDQGTSTPIPSRDYLVFGFVDMAQALQETGFPASYFEYQFADPNNCDNVRSQFGGTVDYFYRSSGTVGGYCGSFATPGYRTIRSGKEATQVYGNATFDVSDNLQLYGNVLYSEESIDTHVGSNYTWWGTGTKWGYYYDPNFDALLNLQRAFAPEEMGAGGFDNSMATDKSEALRFTVGVNGTLGASAWDYDVGYTRTDYKLDEVGFVRWADPINDYFEQNVLGPQQGLDPYYGAYPVFTPDYAKFYSVMSPEDFASFTGYATSRSRTQSQMLRAQITNADLFSLPGGSAGLAIVAEAGDEEWEYVPHPGYLDGSVWGTTAVAGGGDRDSYSLTSELRLPVAEPLTVTLAGRYDAFKASGRTIDKPTYSLGLEYRPLDSLLVRGKYGTAFRSPTLPDLYQGLSGYYTFVTDYVRCAELGFEPGNTANCPAQFANRQVFGQQAGSVDLQPINADVWSAGVVWSPIARMSLSIDYHNWDISDEVNQQNSDALMRQEYRCREGLDDINSALCVATLDQVTRNETNQVVEIFTPKVNVSRQTLEAVTAGLNYAFEAGAFGDLLKLSHKYQQYAEDPEVDYLNDPYWSTDPKHKADASISWNKNKWSSTLYANYISETPNYRASLDGNYDNPLAARLGSFTTYNLSLSYQPLPALQFSVLANNVFDKMPPLDVSYPGTTGSPYNSYNFNPYGRAFYLEARYKFGGSRN